MVSRKQKRSARITRKTHKTATVEGLHASFEKIDNKVRVMIQKGKTDSELACCIRKAWSEQFHTGLSTPAIKGMIMHYRAVHGSKGKGGRKTRKQRGGMAPFDWTMGQGVTDRVYGSFPTEIGTSSQALRTLDRFFESPGGRSCDSTGGHAAPGQVGGNLFDAMANGAYPRSVPAYSLEKGLDALTATRSFASNPSPVTATPNLASYAPRAFDAGGFSSISSMAPIYKGV